MTPEREPNITPYDITKPLNIDDIIKPDVPLDIDIGCGKGRFTLGRAINHPERSLIGIDRLKGRIHKLEGKIRRAGCSNAHLLRLEAFYSVAYLLPNDRISSFFILFPDPWPKKRHYRRRLFCPEFLTTLAQKLTEEGEVHVATDHLEYFAKIRSIFESDPRFTAICPYRRDESEKTDFERLFRKKGKPIAEASYRLTKKPNPAPEKSASLPIHQEPRAERAPSR